MNKDLIDFEKSITQRLLAVFEVIEVVNLKIDKLIKENKGKTQVLQPEDIQNAVAAKIIQEISEKMDKCECTENLLEKLKDFLEKQKEEPLVESKKNRPPFGLHKYSYPNFDVGNASLGSSGNPKAMKWPFGTKD